MKPQSGHTADSVPAAKAYHQQYAGSPAEAYINARGLGEMAPRMRAGYVGSARTGHEKYRGRLAIPYLRPAGGEHGVATIRFRCVDDHCVRDEEGNYCFLLEEKERHSENGCAKYLSLPGDPPRIYNTTALIAPSPFVALVEGELSSWAVELDEVPAIGAQGVSAWKEYFYPALVGYEKVFVLGDGDDAGRQFTEKMTGAMHNAVPIELPQGEDTDSLRLKRGPGSIRTLMGLD